ncbi:MAG TPA: LysM peptidoglycan-binding domain-containing protein [Polyangia bacterium]|nr:LysM peptidoglycan-binding domain-containing protein [Polyangia bacterium]
MRLLSTVPSPRAAAVTVMVGLLAGGAAKAAPTAGPVASGRRAPAAAKGPPPPVEESLSERRAVRGSPVDDGSAAPESPELRELRRFEEQAFPRGTALVPAANAADGAVPLPGQWGGSGDLAPELRTEPRPAGPSAAPAPPDSEWLRSLVLPDLPVRWDPLVLRYLDYFKSDPKGHAIMANWLRRAGRFRALFEKTLERHGLPKSLLYVAMIESGFDTGARSRVGAGGVWQFMPGAARAYGLEVSYWLDGRCDPEKAADAAARYLKDLYVRFGSWPLVFASYNAGYGAVLKSITAYNTNDFWELVRHEAGLPWESSIYVPKIMAAAIVGTNAAAFGFGELTPDAPYAYETAEAPAGTSLAAIARAAGAHLEVIEALNPELVRDRTPPDRGPSRVRLPPGSAAAFAENLETLRASERTETIVLRFGETLDDVARARGTSARELKRMNGVKDTSELRAGVSILVPKRGGAAPRKPRERGEGPSEGLALADAGKTTGPAEAADDDDMVIVAVPDRSFAYEGRERVFYRTRDGDGLEEIAETFGVRADELTEWNNLDPTAKLHPRMVLQIFVRKDFDPVGVMLLEPDKVRVVTLGSEEFLELETARRGKKRLTVTAKAGDTLAKLGRRYGLTPGDLARINRFSYNTELEAGQRIVVYSPTGEPPREVSMGLTPEPRRPKSGLAAGAPASGKTVARPGTKVAVKTPDKPTGRPAAGGKPVASGKPAVAGKPAAGGKPAVAGKPGAPGKPPVKAPAAPVKPAPRTVAAKAGPAAPTAAKK